MLQSGSSIGFNVTLRILSVVTKSGTTVVECLMLCALTDAILYIVLVSGSDSLDTVF